MFDVQTKTFFDLYSLDQASADDIEDCVTAWHHSGDDEQRPLSEYLGMTEDEYAVWVMDARSLPIILAARRSGRPVVGAVADYLATLQAASGAQNRGAIMALSHWVANHH